MHISCNETCLVDFISLMFARMREVVVKRTKQIDSCEN